MMQAEIVDSQRGGLNTSNVAMFFAHQQGKAGVIPTGIGLFFAESVFFGFAHA